jgi:hypothetical protein
MRQIYEGGIEIAAAIACGNPLDISSQAVFVMEAMLVFRATSFFGCLRVCGVEFSVIAYSKNLMITKYTPP